VERKAGAAGKIKKATKRHSKRETKLRIQNVPVSFSVYTLSLCVFVTLSLFFNAHPRALLLLKITLKGTSKNPVKWSISV
jgi:hypothetical protein